MKYYKKISIIILIFFLQCSCAFAQNNYSNAAIVLYNSAAALHNQGKYELAEQKYLQILKIQPDFKEAKTNLAKLYPSLAYEYYSKSNWQKAVYYGKKAVSVKPNDEYSYDILARSYEGSNDYENTIKNWKKVISLNPKNTDAMHSLAQTYIKLKQFDSAATIYSQILSINPSDKLAKQNIEYSNFQKSEKILNQDLNSITTEHTNPKALYALIKPAPGIPANSAEEVKTVLDLVWSEPNGQILLQNMIKNKIPINIVGANSGANAEKTQKTNTLYLYGFIPVANFTSTISTVNIPYTVINNFNNKNLTSFERIYNLQTFIHEFGHAFIGAKIPSNKNSIEEELGVSMLGYNIAHKVITGKYLDRQQTETYSKRVLVAILSDDHRELPIFSGFNNRIQNYGIVLPYPEVYSNIPSMYKTLLLENKVKPVPSFYPYVK